jgi:hypothetical protein
MPQMPLEVAHRNKRLKKNFYYVCIEITEAARQ